MKITKNLKVVVLSHFYKRTESGGGPPQEIRDFLARKIKLLVYIEHPFPYADDRRSSMTVYENGQIKEVVFAFPIYGPQVFYYFIDVVLTWYFLVRVKKKFDLCIALDNLNLVSILPFRKVGLIKKAIFYTIDYSPLRFKNWALNYLYHFIDRIACYGADIIWILSTKMIIAREKNGVDPKRSARNVLLPMGAKIERILTLPLKKIKRYQVIFVGHLLEKQGVQIILEAFSGVLKIIPQAKFVVVGQGEYESNLKQLSTQLNLDNSVEFKGFIEKHVDVERMLCESAIGVAPYRPSKDNYTYYTDPGKPKIYLGCGLPVLITSVPEFAYVIQKKRAGMICDYTAKSFQSALISLLSDDILYQKYRKNALKLSKEYITDRLISNALIAS